LSEILHVVHHHVGGSTLRWSLSGTPGKNGVVVLYNESVSEKSFLLFSSISPQNDMQYLADAVIRGNKKKGKARFFFSF
jgi:hypothetical protein